MRRISVIGCGVVGATIAYELSRVPGLSVTVFDCQWPAQGATRAALGVLMACISQKIKGRRWQLRLNSLQRYQRLIPELEAATGKSIPTNRNGILKLCFAGDDLSSWERLVAIRKAQGVVLELIGAEQVRSQYPYLRHSEIAAAVLSPQDLQVDPLALTQALVAAAQANGVCFHFKTAVEAFSLNPGANNLGANNPGAKPASTLDARRVEALCTGKGAIATDWVIVAAGLGSTPLTAKLARPIDIRPVLGQALHLRLLQPLAEPQHQPIITGNDVHLVPLGGSDYWIGATVEFPSAAISSSIDSAIASGTAVSESSWAPLQPHPELLETLKQQAINFCPALANATILSAWSGLRPRPEGRPAPIVEPLSGYNNVLLATGHYRNGVLLAPATAQIVREAILAGDKD